MTAKRIVPGFSMKWFHNAPNETRAVTPVQQPLLQYLFVWGKGEPVHYTQCKGTSSALPEDGKIKIASDWIHLSPQHVLPSL